MAISTKRSPRRCAPRDDTDITHHPVGATFGRPFSSDRTGDRRSPYGCIIDKTLVGAAYMPPACQYKTAYTINEAVFIAELPFGPHICGPYKAFSIESRRGGIYAARFYRYTNCCMIKIRSSMVTQPSPVMSPRGSVVPNQRWARVTSSRFTTPSLLTS